MSDILQFKCFSKLNKEFVKNIKLFYCFYDNKLFLTKDDLVYGFGKNSYGEIGLGHNREVTEPTIINELCNKQIIQFNNVLHGCFARSIEGKLYCFGSNNRPEIIESLINENVTQVSCGEIHAIVLTQNKEVFGCGHNSWGETGINSKKELISNPTKIIGFNGEKIKSISCGRCHSMALSVNGNVFSWGRNNCGQLGINSTDDSLVPQIIQIEGKNVLFKKISCGLVHSLLLSTNGNIYSFGSNHCNQLGYETHKENYSAIPRMIETEEMMHFSDISCHFGENISTAISSTDGFCYIWGECKKFENVIELLEKTEYKSCEEAIFDITENTIKAIDLQSDIDKNYFFENNFIINKIISKGSFGEVLKCLNRKTKELSAVKRIEIKVKEKEKILRESEVMSQLKNESIVGYKQSWIECNENDVYFHYIEMELCLKTLSEVKEQMFKQLNCKTSLSESRIGSHIMSELIKEMIEGLNYLHKNKIIHRDLKPLNILINDNNINGKYIRIADFGFSRIHDSEEQSLTAVESTLKYMAPELIQSITRPSGRILYTNKVDIYSMGKILEVVFDLSKQRFDSNETDNNIEIIQRMKNMMLSIDPEMRPNCEQLLNKSNDWLITVDVWEVKRILQKSVKTELMDDNFYIYFLNNRLYNK